MGIHQSLKRFRQPKKNRRQDQRLAKHRTLPNLEALEDRTLPSASLFLGGPLIPVGNTNVNVSNFITANASEM